MKSWDNPQLDFTPGNCVLGLDPGATGGIALVTEGGNAFGWSLSRRGREDVASLLRFLSKFNPVAYLEKVGSRPSQASQAVFSFGMAFERLYMGATCFGIECIEVLPKEWQRFLDCPKAPSKKDVPKAHIRKRCHKNDLKDMAIKLFPDLKITLATADALLIGEYGRRKQFK